MHITTVAVAVPDPTITAQFFRDVLDSPVDDIDGTPHIRIGSSTLVLGSRDETPDGNNHLAFDIPENHIVAARDLLRTRIDILPGGNEGIFDAPESWNAESVYFNAPGNLNLELIARHRRQNATSTTFSFADILYISEVGVPVDDTIGAANDLQSVFGIKPFNPPTDMFVPMGTGEGLIILVRTGRIWWPTKDQPATPLPLHVETGGVRGHLELNPLSTISGAD